MKKKVLKEMEVELNLCNVCGHEIISDQFNKKRIEIVKHLFNCKDFDAHEICINGVVKKAFWQYFVEELSKKANKS